MLLTLLALMVPMSKEVVEMITIEELIVVVVEIVDHSDVSFKF